MITRDELKLFALDAGFKAHDLISDLHKLERFAQLIETIERKRCIEVVKQWIDSHESTRGTKAV